MDIRINTLALHNFKGATGDRTFTFGGKNARIEGDNGTGKSTVFDAFTWLLFGNDHLGHDWTNFNIKPIDPATQDTISGLDYVGVEAVLLVDGVVRTLRRELREDWVKPRGQADLVLKGHTQAFYIDGVACAAKKDYDLAIHQLIDEGVFRIITNPHYFIDDTFTDWKERRKVLLSVVGYDPNAVAGDFADLVAAMRGEPVEQFRKRLAADKKAQRDALDGANANIRAWNAALPDEPDTATIQERIDALTADRDAERARINDQLRKVDEGLADIAAANKSSQEAADEKTRQIYALTQKMADYIAEAGSAARKANDARNRAISDAAAEVDRTKAELDSLSTREHGLLRKIDEAVIARGDEAARLTALGKRYEEIRSQAFKDDVETVCPTCGRPYPQEDVAARAEQRRAEFREEQRAALLQLQERVAPIRAEIATWDQTIAKANDDLADVRAQKEAKRNELAAHDQALAALLDTPEQSVSDEEKRAAATDGYRELQAQRAALEAEREALAAKSVSTKDLLADRGHYSGELVQLNDKYDQEVRPLLDALAVGKERQRILGLIADEEKRRAGYADELARLERLEVRTLEYIKASVDACEGAINARFSEARWKMFDRTLDGGIIEMCQVTTKDGVPYRSMNDAARIICGLDVIRVLGEANAVQAPIFIDNAESVTRRSFDTPAQVIRLVVTEGASTLNVKSE